MIQRRSHTQNEPGVGGLLRRPMQAVAALAAAAMLLAGCGSTSTSTGPAAQTASTLALAMQDQMVQTIDQVGPSVVLIRDSQGLGSGIVFDTKGDIVTNNHVVAGGKNLQVVLANGKQYPAQLIGTSPANDLAVLRVNAPGLSQAVFANSSRLEVGEIALAIGNPLGLQSTVTQGIVSALGRTVTEEKGITLHGAIQTSAEINPGNSGGALVNLQGQVIGIPTLAATDPQLGAGAAPGIGFAIPSNTVHDVATQLVNQGPAK